MENCGVNNFLNRCANEITSCCLSVRWYLVCTFAIYKSARKNIHVFDVETANIFTHFQWRIHKLCKLNRKFMLVVVYFYHSITHSPSTSFSRSLFGFSVLISSRLYFSSTKRIFRHSVPRNGINIFIYFGIPSGSLPNFYFEDGSKWMRVIFVCSV